jgi:hypothetical protein
MKIKYITIILLIFASSSSWANENAETAVNYYDKLNRYVFVAYYEPRLFVELRSFHDDKIIDNLVISSRYGIPVHSFKDVIIDDNEEIIIKREDGGSGLYVKQMIIIAVINDKLVEVGKFDLRNRGGFDKYKEDLTGKVDFTKKNELIYRYKKIIIDHGKKTVEKKADHYFFDVAKNKFEKIKKKAVGNGGQRPIK